MPCNFPVNAYVDPNWPSYSFFVVAVVVVDVDIIYKYCLFFFFKDLHFRIVYTIFFPGVWPVY